eukprot:scaffold1291_cov412-Prasinococcus_capsulatus_cf.AAC.2
MALGNHNLRSPSATTVVRTDACGAGALQTSKARTRRVRQKRARTQSTKSSARLFRQNVSMYYKGTIATRTEVHRADTAGPRMRARTMPTAILVALNKQLYTPKCSSPVRALSALTESRQRLCQLLAKSC